MKEMGVDLLQGYFYGRPCKKDDFIELCVYGKNMENGK